MAIKVFFNCSDNSIVHFGVDFTSYILFTIYGLAIQIDCERCTKFFITRISPSTVSLPHASHFAIYKIFRFQGNRKQFFEFASQVQALLCFVQRSRILRTVCFPMVDSTVNFQLLYTSARSLINEFNKS